MVIIIRFQGAILLMVFEAMIPLKSKDYRLNGYDNSIPGGYSSDGLRSHDSIEVQRLSFEWLW